MKRQDARTPEERDDSGSGSRPGLLVSWRPGVFLLLFAACRGAPIPAEKSPATPDDVSAELAQREADAFRLGDLDGDGRAELVVERGGQVDGVGPGHLLAVCDVDGDGKEDPVLAVGNDLVAAGRRAAGIGPIARAACIDPDGDGRYAIAAAGIWEIDGPALVDRAGDLGIQLPKSPAALLVAPVIGAAPDVFVLVDGGPNLYFAAQPNGKWAELADAFGLQDRDEKQRAAAAAFDLDEDGELDLALANRGGRHRLFVRRGGGFLDVAPPPWAQASAGGPIVAGDLDGDGHDEVYAAPGRLFTLRQGLTVPIEPGSLAGLGEVTAAAICDLDGDGRVELIVLAGGKLSLHRARGAKPLRAIRVLTQAGAPARGASVWMRARRVVPETGDPALYLPANRDVMITWQNGTTRSFGQGGTPIVARPR